MKCSRRGLKRKLLGGMLLSALSANAVMAAPTFQEAVSDYNSGKYARALGTLKRFKAQFPNNPLVHYYIALCEQAMGHIPQAQEEYQWVVAQGDSRLAPQAATGLAQLAGKRVSGGGGSRGSYSAATTSPSQPGPNSSTGKPKVSKVLEFWAEW
jgi:predicted Zn-dependent protease